MSPRISRMVIAVSAGSLLAGAPLLAACGGGGPSYSQWAATDGAAGRINLDDVQEAFKESNSATEFETKVNEIYEGDGIILIRARQDGQRLTLEGWEDLDGNSRIDDGADDQLFAIIKENDQHQLRGYHANSYYHSHFGAGDFLFTYLLFSSLGGFGGGPYYYQTTPQPGNHHPPGTHRLPQLRPLQHPAGTQRPVHLPAADLCRFPLPGSRPECQFRAADLPADATAVRRLPQQRRLDPQQQQFLHISKRRQRRRVRVLHLPQRRRRLQRRRRPGQRAETAAQRQ